MPLNRRPSRRPPSHSAPSRGAGWFLVRNSYSGKVLGVDGMSTANSAFLVQYEDNGTPDHLWRFL